MLKASIEKNQIIPALSKAQSIVDKKTIMNIINNVLLYSKDSELFIEATDLEISFRTHIPVEMKEEGSITVSARKLYEIVKEIPFDTFNIDEIENTWLKLYVEGQAEYIIAGLPSDDFPEFGKFPTEGLIGIPSETLKFLIDRTIFSVSYDDRKYALSGILTEIQKKTDTGKLIIRMVSSDGHRLSLAEREIEFETDAQPDKNDTSAEDSIFQGAILPRKGAGELKRLAEDEKTIFLKRDEKFLYAENNNSQLIIRLIDGTFPDYKAIIPEDKERFIQFSRPVFLGALKRISIMSSDPVFKGIKAKISENIMELESIEKKTGQAQEIITIKYSGKPFELAFNAKYMIDALQVMESQDADLIMNDDDSPCIIKAEDDPGFLALIMPMTIEEE